MRTEVHWIPGPWPGRLGIAPRPRGGDWLGDELRSWREAGVDVVVSLLTPQEEAELDLDDEEARSRYSGLEFLRLPIPDRSVPESRFEVADLVTRLEEALAAGKDVAVHCRQGIGRSGLVAALMLVAAGRGPDDAFHAVGIARGIPVPETEEQRAWAEQFAAESAARTVHHG